MALYIPFKSFTMVATPHALQQSLSRAGVPLVDFLATNGFPGNKQRERPRTVW